MAFLVNGCLCRNLIVGCIASWFTAASPSVLGKPLRPFSVDDALSMEEIGAGAFSPSGDVFIYVQAPPYDELPDYGLALNRGLSFGQLMRTATVSRAKALPLLPRDPTAVHALLSVSPDGRYAAYLEAKSGELRLGAVDLQTGEARLADALPQQTALHDLRPVWTGAGKLLFAAREPGDIRPYLPYLRRATGEAMAAEWRKAWAGREASASVYRSRRDGGPTPPFTGRLVEFDVAAGTTAQWASGLFSNLRLSPDGRYVAAVQQFERSQMPADRLRGDWLYGRGRLVLFEVAARRRIDVASELEVFPDTAEWSVNGARIGFFAWREGEEAPDGLFRTFTIESRSVRTLPHTGLDLVNEREFGPPGKPLRLVWIGAEIAVPARPNPSGDPKPRFTRRGMSGHDLNVDPGRFDWFLLSESAPPKNLTARFSRISPWAAGMTASGAYLVLDDEVYRLDAAGRVTSVAAGLKVGAQLLKPRGPRSGAREAFGPNAVYQGLDSRTLNTFDYDRGTVTRIEVGEGRPEVVAIGQSGKLIAYQEIHPAGTDLKMHLADGEILVVARINQLLAGIAKPLNRTISHPGASGERQASCLTLPHDYITGRRYPTLVYAYPDSRPSCPNDPDLQSSSYENRNTLVAKGYALLRVAAPTVATREGGPLSGIVAAVDRAIDAAVAEGFVDADRLGIIGASGAGFSSLWIAGHSKRFKAVVSINGIANLQSDYFTIGVAEFFYPSLSPWYGQATRYEGKDQFGLGITPWDDPGHYWKVSPIAYAKQIDAPVLLVGTDMDVGGMSRQYDEMFAALNRLRKDVDYVKYWGEGHGPSSPANVRDLTRRTIEWFDRYLKAD